jgi:hypothetical protein
MDTSGARFLVVEQLRQTKVKDFNLTGRCDHHVA